MDGRFSSEPVTLSQALPNGTADELVQVAQLFPDVGCPLKPCGGFVVVQDRMVAEKSAGGVYKSNLSQEDEQRQQTIARVCSVGPVAGWDDLNTGILPGWPWFLPGSFVKLSPHSSTRTKTERDSALKGDIIFRAVHFKDVLAEIVSAREVLR